MDRPETRYAKSGDVHIAYQVVGSGVLDLVFVAGFVSKSVECTKLKAILDFNKEIEQRNIDGTPRMVDGRPVRAVMTLARWPDDALEVLREARDGFMASLEGPSDPDQKTDFSLLSNALKHMPRVWGRPSLILVDFSEGQAWSPVRNASW